MSERSDREIFELTDEERAAARAEFEVTVALMTDPEPELEARASFERTMAMTWQERRDRMTSDDSDVIVEIGHGRQAQDAYKDFSK